MPEQNDTEMAGAIALEHLTGPSRGLVTWLNGAALDVSVRADRHLRISSSQPNKTPDELVARLRRVDQSYEIVAAEGRTVWVNGQLISARLLEHRDLIEFGQTGPLSRFRLFHEDRPTRKMVSEILSDGFGYLRASRRPVPYRMVLAGYAIAARLLRETTLLFRGSVVLAIICLVGLAYYQFQLNAQLEQRIAHSASQLEGFAGALTQARDEALTPADLTALRQELKGRLSTNAERLAALERRSEASARVIAQSSPSIAFLQGAFGFRDRASGRMLRHLVDDAGRPLISPFGQPMLALDGNGPVAERQFTGSGFLLGAVGAIVTNRHVARPWEKDANVAGLAAQGLEPVMLKYLAYLPGRQIADAVELARAGEDVDLAILMLKDPTHGTVGLKLAEAPPTAGDEVIVLGYPTGLRSMLAQSGEEFVAELQKSANIEFWSVAARLAEKKYIAPLASRGIVSQVSLSTIVYDAETTHGGSGGPVLDTDGAVVAVNTAILPEYGGSNLGIPAAKVRALLKAAGLR